MFVVNGKNFREDNMFQVVMALYLLFGCVEHTEGLSIYMPSIYKDWDKDLVFTCQAFIRTGIRT